MLYLQTNESMLTLVVQGTVISTAPPMTYPLQEEQVNLPSLQTSAPLLLGLHRISSTRGWSVQANEKSWDESRPDTNSHWER